MSSLKESTSAGVRGGASNKGTSDQVKGDGVPIPGGPVGVQTLGVDSKTEARRANLVKARAARAKFAPLPEDQVIPVQDNYSSEDEQPASEEPNRGLKRRREEEVPPQDRVPAKQQRVEHDAPGVVGDVLGTQGISLGGILSVLGISFVVAGVSATLKLASSVLDEAVLGKRRKDGNDDTDAGDPYADLTM